MNYKLLKLNVPCVAGVVMLMSVPVWRRPAEISFLLAGSSECSRRTRARRAPADRGHTRTAESRTSRLTDPLMLRDAYIHLQHHPSPAPPPLIHCGQNLTPLNEEYWSLMKTAEQHLMRTCLFSVLRTSSTSSTQQKMIFFHKHKGIWVKVKGHHSWWFVLWIVLNIRGLILLYCCNEDFIFTYILLTMTKI